MKLSANFESISLIDRSTELLKDYIIAGEIAAGAFLPPEHELCQRLGIGRSTLREAIKSLESCGFVRRFHGKGVQVVDESEQAVSDMLKLLFRRRQASIREILEVRNIFEVHAAGLAAQRASAEDLKAIADCVEAMKAEEASHEAYVDADLSFHLAVAKATQNQVFVLIFETIRPFIRESILATLTHEDRPEVSQGYHENVFKAIKAKQTKQSRKAMQEHLLGTVELIGDNEQPLLKRPAE